MGGFGGSNKNIGIGCADGRIGKKMIHTREGSSNLWSIDQEELMERMTESAKSVVDHFGKKIVFINVMIKEVLRIREGIDIGGVRKPLTGLNEEDRKTAQEAAKMIDEAVAEYC